MHRHFQCCDLNMKCFPQARVHGTVWGVMGPLCGVTLWRKGVTGQVLRVHSQPQLPVRALIS